MTRLVVSAMNLKLRLQSKPVRAAIRPGDAIERIARENGLAPHVAQDIGPAWHVAVFRRMESQEPVPSPETIGNEVRVDAVGDSGGPFDRGTPVRDPRCRGRLDQV